MSEKKQMIKAKTLMIFIAVMVTTATYTQAREGLGAGIILGEPTGLSLKTWIDDRHAIDAAAAWSFSENDSFQFHADYLVHDFALLKSVHIKKGRLPVYVGIGGRVKLQEENDRKGRDDEDTLVGIRVPFGISYLFSDAPVDIFGEIVPILDIAPDTEMDLNAAIGARFYF
jgi:hypothetical protein